MIRKNHLRYDLCIECTLVHYNHTEGPGAPRTSWNIYLKAININNHLLHKFPHMDKCFNSRSADIDINRFRISAIVTNRCRFAKSDRCLNDYRYHMLINSTE